MAELATRLLGLTLTRSLLNMADSTTTTTPAETATASPRASTSNDAAPVTAETATAAPRQSSSGARPSVDASGQVAEASTSTSTSTTTAAAPAPAPAAPAASTSSSAVPTSPTKSTTATTSTPVASDFAHAALRKFKLVFLGEQSGASELRNCTCRIADSDLQSARHP